MTSYACTSQKAALPESTRMNFPGLGRAERHFIVATGILRGEFNGSFWWQ